MGVIYLIVCFVCGYAFLKKFLPGIFCVSKIKSLSGKSIKLPGWMVTIPAAFLAGTLLVTWITYLITWGIARFFPGVQKPLFYGDLITLLAFAIFALLGIVKKRKEIGQWFSRLKALNMDAINGFVYDHRLELFFILIVTMIWSIFICRSFYIKNDTMHMGISVFSDFGAHIPMIRSFSFGSNFPTEYIHFGDSSAGSLKGNDVRYHFMLQFLVGNLEFLGLRIDWAFNLPSILAGVAFLMLLYSFAVMLFGKKMVGVLTTVLFFFRSSFAFFTYAAGLSATVPAQGANGVMKYLVMARQFISSVLSNIQNIGKTEHEEWGFYSLKVYVNKRHYIFTLGIALLVLIIVYPLFKKMLVSLKNIRTRLLEQESSEAVPVEAADEVSGEDGSDKAAVKSSNSRMNAYICYIKSCFRELFLTKEAWVPKDVKRSVVVGLLLGLIGFWNGAVAIAVLPVLVVMAVWSKHKVEFINTVVIAVILIYGQIAFFVHNSTDKVMLYLGYLATFPDGVNATATEALKQHNFGQFLSLLPHLSYGTLLFYVELLGILPLLLVINLFVSSKGGKWLTLAFLSPLLMATAFQFTIDVGANHVIVIFSVILMNILIAGLLYKLFASKKVVLPAVTLLLAAAVVYLSSRQMKFEAAFLPAVIVTVVGLLIATLLIIFRRQAFQNPVEPGRIFSATVAVILCIALTGAGIVDGIAVYNMDKSSGREYSMHDHVVKWVAENTNANDLFLISPDFIHPVLIAGRKVFLGGAYFVWSAGYEWGSRLDAVKEIYSTSDANRLKALIKQNHINYIVIDDVNRTTEDYKLNEQLIPSLYNAVYTDQASRTAIYKTN